jgi:Tfp pilus assembly protein PilF
MSLLLDALKRAEQAKLAKQAEGAKAKQDVVPGALPEAEVERERPEDYAVRAKPKAAAAVLEPDKARDAGLPPLETPRSGESVAQTSEEQMQRDAARNVFVAKQPASARRAWLLPAILASVAVIGAGAWYVWREIDSLTPRTARSTALPPATPITQAPRDGLPRARPETGQLSTNPVSPGALAGTPPPALVGKGEAPLPDRAASARPRAEKNARDMFIKSLTAPAPVRDSPIALKLSRAIDAPRVNPELADAYTALKSGDYARAKRLYAAVLQADGLSLDGHLGMAAAQARSGDPEAAARAYRKALEIDPANATALAGLIAVSNQTNLAALEAELKTLLGKHPNSSALSFSLGNLYAAQSRWTEAQQAYFDAFHFDPDNADYVYNLAVSLDHLNQPRLALEYYQRAAAAGGKAGAQFDLAQVNRRVNELKSLH